MSAFPSNGLDAILQGPAGPPPPGVVPDPHVSSTLRTQGLIILWFCTSLTTVAYLLRMYTKIAIIHKLNPSDYTVTIAWFLYIAMIGVGQPTFEQVGWGKSMWNVTLGRFSKFMFYYYIEGLIYGGLSCGVKISILLQYMEVFALSKTRIGLWRTCQAVIWSNVTFYCIISFLWIFQCHPLSKFWNVLIMDGYCFYRSAAQPYIATVSINSVSDIVILILPQLVVWKLQASLRKRAAISAIFLIGAFACACSLARLYHVVRVGQTGNATYELYMQGIWCILETCLGIVAACLPTLPKLYKNFKEHQLVVKVRKIIHSSISTV